MAEMTAEMHAVVNSIKSLAEALRETPNRPLNEIEQFSITHLMAALQAICISLRQVSDEPARIRQAVQAERERCLAIARKRAQSHADAGNKLKREGIDQAQIDFEFHRANEAKKIADEIMNPA